MGLEGGFTAIFLKNGWSHRITTVSTEDEAVNLELAYVIGSFTGLKGPKTDPAAAAQEDAPLAPAGSSGDISSMRRQHTLEPELAGPLPRRVSIRKQGVASDWGCTRMLLAPFIVSGAFMLIALLGTLLVLVIHGTAVGEITGKMIVPDENSGHQEYVSYRFRVDGREYRNRDTVSSETYASVRQGAPVTVHYAPLFPGAFSMSVMPGESRLGRVWFLLAFNLIWNGIVGVLVIVYFVMPRIERRLYERGTAVTGEVTGKRNSHDSEGGASQYVDYRFPTGEGRMVSGSVSVSDADWNAVQVGDALTILYDPARPQRNVAYRLGKFVVKGDDPVRVFSG